MKKRGNNLGKFLKIVFIVLSLFMTLEIVSAVECGSVPTDGCDVTQDTTFDTGTYNFPSGISMGANSITLDCNGSTLIGSGSGDGINTQGSDNSIIANCTIQNYSNGIHLSSPGSCPSDVNPSKSNTIQNNTLRDNSIGAWLSGGSCSGGEQYHNLNNQLISNIIKGNDDGVKLERSDYTNITQNIIQNNSNKGLYLFFHDDNSDIYNNNFINNSIYGAHLSSTADNNLVYNNTFYQTSIQYDATNNNKYCLNGEFPNTYLYGTTGPLCDCLPLLNGLSITSTEVICKDTYNFSSGISMGANSVTLDCNGLTLIGSGSGDGINTGGFDNLLIKNCVIQNYSNGIYIRYSGSCSGSISPSNSNLVKNNTLKENSKGLWSLGASCSGGEQYHNLNNQLIGNTIKDNGDGVELQRSDFTNITLNTFQNNSNGVDLFYKVNSNNIFSNNFVDNANQASDSETGNYWNSTEGGNYWNNYDSEAEGCYDSNSNLICDSPYNISGSAGSKDYLPLLGIQILNILPIQVVPDVDMVKDKTTLVRATLKNSATSSKNINVSLYFEGNLEYTNDTASIGAGQEINVNLWFVPNVAGSNKEIRVDIEEI